MAAATTAKAPARAPFRLGQEAILAAILALALLVLAFTSEQFFTVANLLNQGRLACEVGLVALPMTMIIVTGGRIVQYLEAEATELGAGDSVYIDKDVVHGSYNDSSETAHLQVILAPPAGEGG